MKKKNRLSFADWVSVVIAIIGAMFFGAATIGCYVCFFKNPSVGMFMGAFFSSIIPGLITYGVIGATVDFLRGK